MRKIVLAALIGSALMSSSAEASGRNGRIERLRVEIEQCLARQEHCEGAYLRVRGERGTMPFLRVSREAGAGSISFDELGDLYENRPLLRDVGIGLVFRNEPSWIQIHESVTRQ